jgi:MFS family permease
MRATIGITTLGFASYFLTLASLPSYAVRGGAIETTAGLVTTVFVVVTMACQLVVPKAAARFGTVPLLVVGLVALGVPSPLYGASDAMTAPCAIGAVRGLGFATVTVLSALLSACPLLALPLLPAVARQAPRAHCPGAARRAARSALLPSRCS